MTIKNKDGTPYKLTGPNKLAITQDFWRTVACDVDNFYDVSDERADGGSGDSGS